MGAGFIIASLLILFAGYAQLSSQEIEKRARELGMGYRQEFVFYQEEKGGNLPEDGETPRNRQQSRPVKEVLIPGGSTLKDVSQILFQTGVISSSAELEREIQKRNLGRKIVAGRYTFEGTVDLEEVINKITKK